MAHKKTAKPRSFSEYWDGGSCGLTGALAPWSERRGHSGRVRKALPDSPPHGRAAVRRGGGREARKKRRFVFLVEGGVGGWCDRWRTAGHIDQVMGGSAASVARIRSPRLPDRSGRRLGPTHPRSATTLRHLAGGEWLRDGSGEPPHFEVHTGSISKIRRNSDGRQ